MTAKPSPHLVIVGGGHAHVFVLKSLAVRREPTLRITLVSPSPFATYTGMVPGVLAGQYRLPEAQIDVRALAELAHAAFVPDRVVRIDAARRVIELSQSPPLSYDLLSLDIGSEPAAVERVSPDAPATMVKPIEVAVTGIEAALALPAPPAGRRIVVVGAGAGGTEIAFALASRLRREGAGSVMVCDRDSTPVRERGRWTADLVARTFAHHGIIFRGGREITEVDRRGVHFGDGDDVPADLIVWATGAAGPSLLTASGLPVDKRGFLRVGTDLRCMDHPEIFAAGDCATMGSHPDLPKAGVYAVRQGPVLVENLRAAARGVARLQVYEPQRRFLSLLNTGDGQAILSYAGIAWRSALAWRLKDRIDRAFIRRYTAELRDTR